MFIVRAHMAAGYVAIVLHAHLPFVRHPEHRDHLEERWLYEAILECYLPLIDTFERLLYDEVPFKVTVSISPPLMAMLTDPVLQARFERHVHKLDRLLDREIDRTAKDPKFGPVVRFYEGRWRALMEIWARYRGNLASAFAHFEQQGVLEVWTSGATHGFLPSLVHHPRIIRAQVSLAVNSHHKAIGRLPRGFWLPECGFAPGVDQVLTQYGLAYTALETHALSNARPRPRFAPLAPAITPKGLACFARDPDSSHQVWSKQGGYPGDSYYREFYRDVGYDNPYEDVKEFVAADGTRQATGLKYYKITGRKTDQKEPYDPAHARTRARMHAADFVKERIHQIAQAKGRMDVAPVILAPYDAELFGHWWFEGPAFLEDVFRAMAEVPDLVASTTLGDYIAKYPTHDICEPEVSSWGAGGYAGVWLDPSSGWMLRHVDFVAGEVVNIARKYGNDPGILGRIARQAVREAMLLISSDWAFLIKNATAPHYSQARFEAHLARFRRLSLMLQTREIDEKWLSDLESRDNIFHDVPLEWATDSASS